MRTTSSSCCTNHAGTTLVELLIAMAIVGLIMGAITSMFAKQRKAYAVQEQVAAMTQQAQAAMELVSRELRAAGTNLTGATFTPVTYSPTQLEIRSNLGNNNNTTDDPNEHVIYAHDAAARRITRQDGVNVAEVVAETIQAFNFAYLKKDGSPATLSSDIRAVRLTITARTAAPDSGYKTNGGYRTYSLISVITLRN
jgi:type II secretory pathway pseudopilin PulG